eukprot:GHVU01022918.1.p4 GENE.GHVU01022918.1~~GHVU01022918.1.p4  ORF type:complete len:101 (+),score=13.83 GHVU01022918.1:27-329(+)
MLNAIGFPTVNKSDTETHKNRMRLVVAEMQRSDYSIMSPVACSSIVPAASRPVGTAAPQTGDSEYKAECDTYLAPADDETTSGCITVAATSSKSFPVVPY